MTTQPQRARIVSIERLRAIPLLAALDDGSLEQLAVHLTPLRLEAGEALLAEGERGDALFIVESGGMEVTAHRGGGEVLLGRVRAGDFVGEVALLGGADRTATVRAERDSLLLRMEAARFRELIALQPDFALRVLQAAAVRLSATETLVRRNEALASLGTLAAGLAHELNNPAAAIRATSGRLAATAARLERLALAMGERGLGARAPDAMQASPAHPAAAEARDDRHIADVLANHRVSDAHVAAAVLAAAGWSANRLAGLVAALPETDARLLLEWLATRVEVRSMAGELEASARAISDVVAAVRAQVVGAGRTPACLDVEDSIRSALLVLRSRLRGRVHVRLRVPREVLRVHSRPGDLAQVWTNLIANAAEAGASRLGIRVRRRGDMLCADFLDNGRGVPPSLQRNIFEPFFTTRAAEGGSGLGLHIVRSIVVQHPGGRVDLCSRPGRTRFRIVLPLA